MIASTPVIAPILIAERRVVRLLREAGAVTEQTAAAVNPPRRLHRKALVRLQAKGVVRAHATGALWLDEAAYAAMRRKRRKAAVALIGAIAGAVAAMLLTR